MRIGCCNPIPSVWFNSIGIARTEIKNATIQILIMICRNNARASLWRECCLYKNHLGLDERELLISGPAGWLLLLSCVGRLDSAHKEETTR